jgi:hypothetical protein
MLLLPRLGTLHSLVDESYSPEDGK